MKEAKKTQSKKSLLFYRPNGDIKGVGTVLVPHLSVSLPAMEGVCGDDFPQLRTLEVATDRLPERGAIHDYRVEKEKLVVRAAAKGKKAR